MDLSLMSGDLQRDRRGVKRRLEELLELNWARYMDNEMSKAAFLRAWGSVFGVRPTVQEPELISLRIYKNIMRVPPSEQFVFI